MSALRASSQSSPFAAARTISFLLFKKSRLAVKHKGQSMPKLPLGKMRIAVECDNHLFDVGELLER
jgi:hypothetical protein